MDEEDGPAVTALLGATKAPAAPAAATPPAAPDEDGPAVRALMNPIGHTLDEGLKRADTWDVTADRLKQLGVDPENYRDKKQHFDLAVKKKELSDRGLSFSQSWRGTYQPFGSVVTVPESVVRPLDYASRELGRLGGKEQPIGGRVVGNNEYNQAVNRFKANQATDDDIEAIATYERHAQIRGEISKGANFAQKLVLETGGLGTLAAETMTGSAALAGAAKVGTAGLQSAGLVSRAAPAVAAAAGTAPAVPAALGLGARATNLALATAVTPSMYVPMMQQANMRAGREDANDFRGLPTAYSYAYANMLVLGRLGNSPPAASAVGQGLQALKKGVFGVAELQGVDAAAGAADQFLNKAYQFKPDDERFGTIGSWLRAYRAGDKEKASEVLRDTTVQALAFAGFAALHGHDAHAADLSQTYADTIGTLRAKGNTRSRAAELVGELHVKLEDALSKDRYLSREGAREALGKDLPAELKSYAEKLADTFEPKSKLPTPEEVAKTTPVPDAPTPPPAANPPEVAAAAAPAGPPSPPAPAAELKGGDRVQDPTRPHGDPSVVAGIDPTDPNPNRRVSLVHSDGSVTTTNEANLAPVHPDTPAPVAPTVLGTGAARPPEAKVQDAAGRVADLEARVEASAAAVKSARPRAGTSLESVNGIRRQHEALTRQLVEARRELAAAATPVSDAPGTLPVEPQVSPSNIPAKPSETTGAPAVAQKQAVPSAETAKERRQRLLKTLAGGAAPRPVDARSDLKARFAAAVEKSGHEDKVKNGHVDRFNALVNELPEASVKAIAKTLTGVEVHRTVHDVTGAILDREVNALRATGAHPDKILEKLEDIGAWERGELRTPGAVTGAGVLIIDGHETGPRADRGHYGTKATVRAEEVLGHEAGHLLEGGPGIREISSTPEWGKAHEEEFGLDKDGVPKLSEYAMQSEEESHAEFHRLVTASDVPHPVIARKFPQATKIYQDRGHWPDPEHQRPEVAGAPERAPEVFNEKIELSDGSHADAVKGPLDRAPGASAPPKVAAAATGPGVPPDKLPRGVKEHGPKVGQLVSGGFDAARYDAPPGTANGFPVIVTARPQVRLTREGPVIVKKGTAVPARVGASGRPGAEVAATATESADAKAGSDHYEKLRSAFIDHVSKLAEAETDPVAKDHLETIVHNFPTDKLIGAGGWKSVAGGRSVTEYAKSEFGKDVKDALTNVPVAIAARVRGEQVAADATPPRSKPGGANPVTREPTRAEWQDQFDSMEPEDKEDIVSDPEQRKLWKSRGLRLTGSGAIDTSARVTRRGVQTKTLANLDAHIAEVAANDALSVTEQTALTELLRGKSTRGVGGMDRTSVRKYAARALEKMKESNPDWEQHDDVNSIIEYGKEEAIKAGEYHNLATQERFDRASNVKKASDLERDEDGFGVAPFRLSRLAALFAPRAGGRSVWQRLSSAFFGDLPSAIRAAHEQEVQGQIAAYAFDVRNGAADLRTAVAQFGVGPVKTDPAGGRHYEGKPYEHLTAAEMAILKTALTTKPTDPNYASVMAPLATGVRDAVSIFRSQVDNLSTRLIDIGAVDGPLAITIGENRGEYLTRQFRVFSDPQHEAKLRQADPAVINRFKSWLTDQLITKGKGATPEEVEAITKSLLRDGTAAENPIAFLSKSHLGALDLSILKKRGEIPEELRALWGEEQDVIANYAQTVGKLAHNVTSYQFLKRIVAEGKGKFFFDAPTETQGGDHVHRIGEGDNPALGPLAPYYMTKELKAALSEKFDKTNTSWGMQWYMKGLAAAKFSKTILSHVGQIHNFLSNVLIAVRDGDFNVTKVPDAVRAIISDTPKGRETYRRYIELGIVGEGVTFNDFQKTMQDAHGGREYFQGLDGNRVANGLLGRMLKGTADKMAALYNYGDAVWKVYGFENTKADYLAAGYTPEAAERVAAEITRDQKPTYSKIAPGIQALRKAPLAAPFVAFQAEMVRTTKNAAKRAVIELMDPRTRAIGAKRLAGLAAAAALPLSLAAATRAMFGVSSDEEDALRRYAPDWQKNSQFVYFGRDPKTGHPKYMDLSKIDPHAYMMDGVMALWRDPNTKGVKNAADEWAKPFTQEELLVQPAVDIARNTTKLGAQVYNPQATTVDQAGDIARHAGDPFVPAAYGPVRRMAMALAGSPEQKSGKEYDVNDTVLEQAGLKIETPRVREDLTNKALGFEKAKKEADKLVNTLVHAKGTVSPQELQQAQGAAAAARARVFEEFRKDVAAAERLNVSRQEIAGVLRNAGVSISEIGQLFSQVTQPYLPALKGTAQERTRAGEVRKLGVAPATKP